MEWCPIINLGLFCLKKNLVIYMHILNVNCYYYYFLLTDKLLCKVRPVWERVSTYSLKFYSALPCPTPQTALWPFEWWPARRAVILRPSSSPLDTSSRTGLCKVIKLSLFPLH
jgi:hypothetical protein